MVCGVVCSTSSGFSSGCCSWWGFLASGFCCVCVCVVCVCVCVRARARGLAHLVFLQERKNILIIIKHTTILVFHN